MTDNALEHRLKRLTWPAPASGLRTRVVSSATLGGEVSWVDRVWFSRAWRLAAAAVVAGLVAVEAWAVVPGAPVTRIGRRVATPPALALSDLGLPTGVVDALANRRSEREAWTRLRLPEMTGDLR